MAIGCTMAAEEEGGGVPAGSACCGGAATPGMVGAGGESILSTFA